MVIRFKEEEDQNHGLNRRLHKIDLGQRGEDLVVDMGHQCIEKTGISEMDQGPCGMDLVWGGMDQGLCGMDLKKIGMVLDQ